MNAEEGPNTANRMETGQRSYRDHTQGRRFVIQDEDDLFRRVRNVLDCLDGSGLDLPIFLHALSWGAEGLISDNKARYHRSVLMNSTELPEIIKQWSRRSEAAQRFLTTWAVDHVTQRINTEMNAAVEKLRCDGDDLSEQTFLSITPQSMESLLEPEVPTLWTVLKSAAKTSQQEKRNKDNSKKVRVAQIQMASCACLPFTRQNIPFIVCQLAFSRNRNANLFHKFFTVYLKGCGLPAKAIDTMSSLGLTMS